MKKIEEQESRQELSAILKKFENTETCKKTRRITSGPSGPSRNGPCMYGIGKSQEPFGALRGQPTLLSTGKVGEAPTSPSWLRC